MKRIGEVAAVGSGVTLGKDVIGFKSVELPYRRVANVQVAAIDADHEMSAATWFATMLVITGRRGDAGRPYYFGVPARSMTVSAVAASSYARSG